MAKIIEDISIELYKVKLYACGVSGIGKSTLFNVCQVC